MTLVEALTTSPTWRLAGWTMLHFLWVGGLIGVALGLLRCALRTANSEFRYGVAVLGLASLALSPAIIAWNLASNSGRNPEPSRRADPAAALTLPNDFVLPPSAEAEDSIASAVQAPERADSDSPLPAPVHNPPQAHESTSRTWSLESLAKVLPALWLGGAPSTFLFLAFGVAGAQRLRRQTILISRGELLERFQRLANEMGIKRTVRLGTLDRLNGPILIGIARPLIVLPASVLLGWSPDLIEMALLHELAHVRRHDNFVNLIQCIIEALLFFHPVVWWASRWARLERELCCDDLVIARTGQPRRYAELLAAIAMPNLRWNVPLDSKISSAMAAPPIVERIRHILICKENDSMRSSPAFLTLAGICLIAPAALIASQAGSSDQEPATDSKETQAASSPQNNQNQPADPRLESIYQRVLRGADVFKNMQARAYTYQRVAAAKAKAGDREGAKHDFEQALKLAEQVRLEESSHTPHLLLWIARTQMNVGLRHEAIETSQAASKFISTPTHYQSKQLDFIKQLIRLQVDLGEQAAIKETLQIATRLLPAPTDLNTIQQRNDQLIQLQIEVGDLNEGLRLLNETPFVGNLNIEQSRIHRRAILFRLLRELKQSKTDNDTAESILQEVNTMIKASQLDRSRSGIRNRLSPGQDLGELGSAYARLGRFEEALRTARSIAPKPPEPADEPEKGLPWADSDRFHKMQLFVLIGKEQLKRNDKDGAVHSADEAIHVSSEVQDTKFRMHPLECALVLKARAGESEQALQFAAKLDTPYRDSIMIKVADIQEEQGNRDQARRTRETILKTLQAQLDALVPITEDNFDSMEPEHNRLLSTIGRLQEQLGEPALALKSMRRARSRLPEFNPLGDLAALRAKRNDLTGAIEAAEAYQGPDAQANALLQVLDNLYKPRSTQP